MTVETASPGELRMLRPELVPGSRLPLSMFLFCGCTRQLEVRLLGKGLLHFLVILTRFQR